ncbi:MAG: hypothetical protein HY766_04515 [candidate division NC10 bacterium]|nr:hypothetical protein [candidate division NC10 bacterium]MBI4839601.1 hypothetical protein [candidate division NC10 bacterium]
MNVYEKRNAILGVEFDRYVRDHSSFAARIPRGAQIVLQLPDDPRFNAWARRLAKRQRQSGQPVVLVTIARVQPPKSRLIAPRLQIEAA